MALNPNELFSSAAGAGSGPSIHATVVKPKVFAQGSGTLAVGAPVSFNTSTGFWAPWTNAGSNGENVLKGIVYPDAITLDSDEEVIGHVMLEGRIHEDTILAATAESDSNVRAELREEARLLGIHVEGLTQVR